MRAPVKRDLQIITSPFGDRIFGGKKQFHGGVDLRSRDIASGKLQPVVLTERSVVLRFGTDVNGNDFVVVKPQVSDLDEIKYIHITYDKNVVQEGVTLEEDTPIGYTQIKGQSAAHHLHFETWKKLNGSMERLDPVLYFKKYGVAYKYKGDDSIPGE